MSGCCVRRPTRANQLTDVPCAEFAEAARRVDGLPQRSVHYDGRARKPDLLLVPRLLERFCKAQVNGQALLKLVHRVAPEGVCTATELQHTFK